MKGKRILITGAARGIGRAVAEAAASAGAVVGVNYLTSEAAAADLLSRFPGRVVLLKANVRDSTAVEEMMTRFTQQAGGIDVLVNNAGVAEARLLFHQSPAEIRTAVDTNLLGAIFTTQAALGPMSRQGGGLIVFHSSVAADQPRPGLAAYAAAKAGVEAFARAVALENRKRGIRTVCLRLGPTQTDMYAARPEAERQRVEARILAGRVPDPEAVARFISSLIRSEDTLLDGCVIVLDSGYSLGPE
jgi:NAD(P)-dependent dehydrogenase (short-subunit alcohol dehydrogenase family)